MEGQKTYKISFLSGKGGVGKSIICANLARFFIRKFDVVLIWDNNLNYPIQHFLNGVEPNVRLVDVLKSSISIEYAVNRVNNRLFFVGGSSDITTDFEENHKLIDNFFALVQNNDFDIVMFDHKPGFDKTILEFARISDLNLVFLSDEPTSIFDSYGLVKFLYGMYGIANIGIVINNVVENDDGVDIANKFNLATATFLGKEFPMLGIIPYERELKSMFLHQELFVQNRSEGEFYTALVHLAENIFSYLGFVETKQTL